MDSLFPENLIHQFDGPVRIHLPVDFVIDHQDGSKATGTEAGHGFNGKHHIGRGLVLLIHVQPLSQSFQDGDGALDVAGGTITEPDDVFSFGFECEVGVEGGDPKNSCWGYAKGRGHIGQDFFGKVAVFLLDCL